LHNPENKQTNADENNFFGRGNNAKDETKFKVAAPTNEVK